MEAKHVTFIFDGGLHKQLSPVAMSLNAARFI